MVNGARLDQYWLCTTRTQMSLRVLVETSSAGEGGHDTLFSRVEAL
jgi:hypothetical protein